MTDQSIRVAVIGTGKIAELGHLPGYVKAGARIVALYSRNAERLERVADAFQVDRCYTDWRLLLAEGGFNAVSICTPPALHREMAVEALDRGYHVLVEKPMAVSIEECDDMIAAAKRSDGILMIAHNQRFRAQHIFAKEILDSGRLGPVRRVHAEFAHGGPERWSPTGQWYFDKDYAGFGVLIDLGYHKIDLLRWLLGQEVAQIRLMTATFEKPTTLDDSAVAMIRFDGGALGTLQVSWAHHPNVLDCVAIDCEKGTITVLSDYNDPLRILEQSEQGELIESAVNCHTSDGPGWLGAVGAFVMAIREDRASPVPGTEGRATLDAVMRAYANQ